MAAGAYQHGGDRQAGVRDRSLRDPADHAAATARLRGVAAPAVPEEEEEMKGRRFAIWNKVLQRCIRVDGCLVWTGPTSGHNGRGRGYPRMNVDGATMAVHIVMWVIDNGPVPPKKQLD